MRGQAWFWLEARRRLGVKAEGGPLGTRREGGVGLLWNRRASRHNLSAPSHCIHAGIDEPARLSHHLLPIRPRAASRLSWCADCMCCSASSLVLKPTSAAGQLHAVV